MLIPNTNYNQLKQSYLFHNIALKVNDFQSRHPDKKIYRLGIGDVSLPLCPCVCEQLHAAVEDQAHAETFHGYMP